MKAEEIIQYGSDARQLLAKGINKVARAVGSTMGPCGQTVVIGQKAGAPIVTKDGVTVANAVVLIDPVESMGAELVKEAARATVDLVEDGTTTCTVLTSALIAAVGEDELRFRQDIINLFSQVEKSLYTEIDKLTQEVTPEMLYETVLISSSGDKELAQVISDTFQELGANCNLSARMSNKDGVSVDHYNGFHYGKGFIDVNFINVPASGSVKVNKPVVILVDGKLENFQDFITYMGLNSKEQYVIVADDYDPSFIQNCLSNKNLFPITAPQFAANRKLMVQDLCAFTGAGVISATQVKRQNRAKDYKFGKLISLEQDVSSTLLKANKNNKALKDRINVLKSNKDKIHNPVLVRLLEERLSNLLQNKAVITIGGGIGAAIKERFDRAEDAIGAAKAAASGITPGGGSVLYRLGDNQDYLYLGAALKAPFYTLMANRGVSEKELVRAEKALDKDPSVVIDIATLDVCDPYERGILDAAAVTKAVIKYSFSAALQVLTTGCALQDGILLRED